VTEPDPRLPVNVLTGFLGSGKTTVLRHVLQDPAFSDAAVLINEFGAVGLDHLLVGALDDAPVLMPGGCICCGIRGDLARALRDLHAGRQRGDVPPFRRVIVETTGLADPAPILATIAADLVVRRHFRPGVTVTTVDAVNALAGLDRYPEMPRQVAVADRLILTKPDLADTDRLLALRERLARLNPTAPIEIALHGAIDPEALLGRDIADPETRLAEAAAWLNQPAPSAAPHGAICAFTVSHAAPIEWNAFGLWFSLLVHRHGTRLLRVKGILDVAGSATPVAVHAVQHLVHAPEHLPAWPDAERGSRLVFITDGLDEAAVRRSFAAFAQLG
jgi:G3E family GTPase